MLVRLEGKQVRDVLALRVPSGFGEFVCLCAVDAAKVREEQQPVVGGGHEEVFNDVVTAQLGAA